MKLAEWKDIRARKFSADEGVEKILPQLGESVPEPVPWDDLELTDEDLKGRGRTAEEIARSPEIGAWKDDPNIPSGEEFVERVRKGRRQNSE
jgi:hypothetical protein